VTYLVYAGAWFGMLVIAIINGAIRDKVYGPYVSKLAAHQVATLIGITLFGVYIWFLTGLRPLESATQAWLIGLMWIGMTVCFEFGFFHFVMKHPWSELLADYNILKGRVFALLLLWTLIAPWVFFTVRGSK
jgi:hypothetical protein